VDATAIGHSTIRRRIFRRLVFHYFWCITGRQWCSNKFTVQCCDASYDCVQQSWSIPHDPGTVFVLQSPRTHDLDLLSTSGREMGRSL
jgi:hypothetical protein